MSITKREGRMPRTLEESRDLFDAFVNDRFRSLMAGESPFERVFEGRSRPMRIEEYVDGNESVIRAELPGIDPERDVEISVDDGVLSIRASREERSEEKRPDGYRTEFHYGSLVRSFRLPDRVSGDDVRATYTDGILEVRVSMPPEPEAKPPHKIAISRS